MKQQEKPTDDSTPLPASHAEAREGERRGLKTPVLTVLVAEDVALVRCLLVEQIARCEDLRVVGQAEDGREAVEMALSLRPDIIVMDLAMPHMSGLQATERIVAVYPHTRVLLLTAHQGLSSLGRYVGVTRWLDKNCTPAELLSAIRSLRSPSGNSADQIENSDYEAVVERLAMRMGLTAREQNVVKKALDPALTIHQIADRLSREMLQTVTVSSVKHTLERAITKLRIEPRSRAALVKYVLEFETKVPDSVA